MRLVRGLFRLELLLIRVFSIDVMTIVSHNTSDMIRPVFFASDHFGNLTFDFKYCHILKSSCRIVDQTACTVCSWEKKSNHLRKRLDGLNWFVCGLKSHSSSWARKSIIYSVDHDSHKQLFIHSIWTYFKSI